MLVSLGSIFYVVCINKDLSPKKVSDSNFYLHLNILYHYKADWGNPNALFLFAQLEFAASHSVLIWRAVLMIFLVASMYPFSPMCIIVAQQAAMIPPGLEPATEGEA